ncbi:uncharacterized protein si:ch73-347e22.4 isoform X1 [Esox lucius]|uniref:uncharacterized protein si:ch73-347e22.4 isoform X1 n=2 Tax=Esox lucius TaxID=8010 RepID=UPI001476E524|nr:uncharacterized protein si:ch73-347e22.4 isoform X1 [Esox lucius]XP_010899195.3 uncharacterized protein si:ch73-347e22.4 isoform X1 [Esox lucius]XP_010899196.3 uncharacterized protein si:ch73-347e22.4 isoform X1 [Esox lucius]
MEERCDSVDKAGDNSKHAARFLPSRSCQQITKHKKRKVEDGFLANKPSKTMAAPNVKAVANLASFPDMRSHSKSMAQDVLRELSERKATEIIQDKCLPFSEELFPVGQTKVQETGVLVSGFDIKNDSGRGPAFSSLLSSNLSKNTRNVTPSPTSLVSQQSSLSDFSVSDPTQYLRGAVDEKSCAVVSHQMLPPAETEKVEEKMSFNSHLPVMKKQQKRKVGRPYKKKTLVKMAKLFAIAQDWDSDATEIAKVTQCNDILTSSHKETNKKKKDEMLEFPPTSSNTSSRCNAKSESSNQINSPIAHSDGVVSLSDIDGPSISIKFNQLSRNQITLKTIQKEEALKMKVLTQKLITVSKVPDMERSLTQNTLVPPETACSVNDNTENARKVQKRPGKKKVLASKAGKRQKQMFKRSRKSLTNHTNTQSQTNNPPPPKKCIIGISTDATPLQSFDIKTEPADLKDTCALDDEINLKRDQKREPPSKCISEESDMRSRCLVSSITQKEQGTSSDMTMEIKDNINTEVINSGNQGEMTPKTHKLLQLKNIEDMLKSKRKAGRPFKKKTLFKMAKLLAIAEECRSNDTKGCDMIEECDPKSHQAVPVCPPLKSEVTEKIVTKASVLNVKSSRAYTATQNTLQPKPNFALNFIQPVPSDIGGPILKSEDTTLIPSMVSPIPKQKSHQCAKTQRKNTTSNQQISSSVPHPSDSMALDKVVSTRNIKETKKSIGSQLLCTNGIPKGDVCNQTNSDGICSNTSAPNVSQSWKSKKRRVPNRKGTEKVVVPLCESTDLLSLDSLLPVRYHSTSQEKYFLPIKKKTESDTAYLKSIIVTKSNPKMCKSGKKSNIGQAHVPTLDPPLGMEHRRPDVSQVNQMRQVEAVIESVIEDIHKPLENVCPRFFFKEDASYVSESTLNPSLGAEHRNIDMAHVVQMRQVEAVIESVIEDIHKPLEDMGQRQIIKKGSTPAPILAVEHSPPDMPQVDHIRQMEAVMESVIKDHKKGVSDVHASEQSIFPPSDNQFECHNHHVLSPPPLQSNMKTGSSRMKNPIPKTTSKNRSKTCRKEKSPKKAAIPTSGSSSYAVHAPSKSVRNSKSCPERKMPLQKDNAQVPTWHPSLEVKQRSPKLSHLDQQRDMEALTDSVNEDLDKLHEHKEQQKMFKQIRQVEAVIESVIEDLHLPLNPTGQQVHLKEPGNVAPLEETTFRTLDDLPSSFGQNYLQPRKTKSDVQNVTPKTSTKIKSKEHRKHSSRKRSKNVKKANVLTSDSSIGAKDGCHDMPSYLTKAEKGEKSDRITNSLFKHEKEALKSATDGRLETAAHKPSQRKWPKNKLNEESNGPPSEQNTFPALDNMLELATPCTLPEPIPTKATKTKSKVCRELTHKNLSKKSNKIAEFLEIPSHLTEAETRGKCDGKSQNNLAKHENESVTDYHSEPASLKPHQSRRPRKKIKIEDINVTEPEPEQSLSSDSQLQQREHVLQQVSLLKSEVKTEPGMEHTILEMATKNTKECRKRELRSKILSGKDKRPVMITSNPTPEVECPEIPSHLTHAEQNRKSDGKANNNLVKDETVTLVNMEAAHKQLIGSKKCVKQEICNVTISEKEATLNDSTFQQMYLLASGVKSESKNEHILSTQKNNISEACEKSGQSSEQTANTTEIPTPPSSKLSFEMEDGYSVMTKSFTCVDQDPNILDTHKGSKERKESGSTQAISNVRYSRRPSKCNSHMTTELMQDQPVISVASYLTNLPTSPASTTVYSVAAQGQITELVSAEHRDKMPHKIRTPLTKKKLQRHKHTGDLDKNVTGDNALSAKLSLALLKEKGIVEDKSPENYLKEKKGRILKTDSSNRPSQHSPSQVKNVNAIADDALFFKSSTDEPGHSTSLSINQISALTLKRKGKRVKAIASTPKIPFEQPCINIFQDKTSLCVTSIPVKQREPESRSYLIKSYLNDASEFMDFTLAGNQTMRNNCKKSITVEPTLDKEIMGLDIPTAIANKQKKKRGRPFKKRNVITMSCRQQKSNTSGELTVNQKQNIQSVKTPRGEKMLDLNPVSKPSTKHTRASKVVKLEEIVLERQKGTWESMDVSSNIFSPQTTANSPNILMHEFETSQTSETIVFVDAGVSQGIQEDESAPLTATVTKQPHNVTAMKKKRRTNKTGWATKVKSKRLLSKVNCRDTLEELVQSSIDNPGLSFKSSLCKSLTENGTLECVDKERECRAVTNNSNIVHVKINPQVQPLSACAKRQASSALQKHVKTKKPMSCLFCGRSFRHISAYTMHKRIHTGEKPYRCQNCGKSFAQLSQLNSHSNLHKHGPMQCPCCITQTPNKDDLIDHFKIHIKDTRRFSLNNSRREIKIQPYADYIDSPVCANGRKSLRCSTCLKDFFNKATLKMHLQLHSGVRSFTCKICSKRFSNISKFNAHEKTHWPVKPYACSVCGKAFDLLRELKTHSNMHSGDMPFFCNHCGQSFSNFSSLRSHQVSKVCFGVIAEDDSKIDIEGFLVEKRAERQINTPLYFKCQICKQLYRHWCQYILHLQTHTNNKPNLCEICGQQYYQEVPELCVHCLVCCKSSGEQRACNSSMSDVWHKPQPLQNQTSEIDLDSLYKDHQEMSTEQHTQCKESEPLPSLKTLEECSSDAPQNPNSACQTPGNELEIHTPTPSNSRCPSPSLPSLSAMSCNSERSKFRSSFQTHARYSCRQCGKSFTWWHKLWLHQGLHREKRCSFPCTQCNLKFRFFGSYREHMQEHAAQRPYACPLCPKTYAIEEDLNTHLCENHQPSNSPKCDTCGKGFTRFRNLERHRLLHRGAISHYCIPCNLPFPSNQALQNHLKSHEVHPVIPNPNGPLKPLNFPYHCRKCKARFTTSDLLQAHQVCHLTREGNTSSSSANIVSDTLTSKLSNELEVRVMLSPQTIPCLPLSKKKHLYRYPNPDHLYVVPKISSQPPVIISDTEEDSQMTPNYSSPSILSCNTVFLEYEGQTSPRNDCCEASNSDLPQPSSSSCVLIDEPANKMPKHQIDTHIQTHKPLLPYLPMNVQTQSQAKFVGDDNPFFRASTTIVIPRGTKQRFGGFECADCLVTFSDISELHEHYLHHARGVK